MQVCIMRHGIAVDRVEPDGPPDSERPLTPKGRDRTLRAAEGLKALGLKPDLLLTSPFLRALQTAEIVAGVLDIPPAALERSDALLPEANPAELFRLLCRGKARSILCFGHAPHVDEAIAFALGLNRPFTALKKAGAACISLDGPFPPRGGVLEWLHTAKSLRLLKGK
jgi:phosphohistidine phosphatase